MAKSKTEERGPGGYALATVETLLPEGVLWDDLKDNLEDLGDVPIPRIKFDSSEAAFYFNEDDDDEEPTKEFEGVILGFYRQNTYWSSGYDQNERVPPECVSLDNKTGNKYGACKTCTFNQFGSALQGKGKACRNQIKLYVQLDGKAIPQRMFLSPSNLRAFTSAFMIGQVSQKGLAFWKVRVKVTGYKNKKETFGRIKFQAIGSFKGEELERIREMRTFWLPILDADHFAAGNFNSPDTNDESTADSTDSADSADSADQSDNSDDDSTNEAPQSKATGKTVKPKSKKVEPDNDPIDDDDPPF
jgi:hypothetical protein